MKNSYWSILFSLISILFLIFYDSNHVKFEALYIQILNAFTSILSESINSWGIYFAILKVTLYVRELLFINWILWFLYLSRTCSHIYSVLFILVVVGLLSSETRFCKKYCAKKFDRTSVSGFTQWPPFSDVISFKYSSKYDFCSYNSKSF